MQWNKISFKKRDTPIQCNNNTNERNEVKFELFLFGFQTANVFLLNNNNGVPVRTCVY